MHKSAKTAKLHDFEFEIFNHQIIAILPQNATEKVRLLEYVRNLGSSKKVSFWNIR